MKVLNFHLSPIYKQFSYSYLRTTVIGVVPIWNVGSIQRIRSKESNGAYPSSRETKHRFNPVITTFPRKTGSIMAPIHSHHYASS
jgi:hypothetical protein